MNHEGSQLARAMLSIHEVELEQASRYGESDLSDRVERRVAFGQRRKPALCRLGSLLVRLGRHLELHGTLRWAHAEE